MAVPHGRSTWSLDGMNDERWVLGLDDDGARFLRLSASLKLLKFTVDAAWDPKDLDNFPLSCPDGAILVEAVTSEGLVVTGPTALIAALKTSYDAQT
jgi:hypothetical protein